MAGDWIKMRTELDEEPEVVALSAQLFVTEQTIVGCLHKLWSIGDKHTADGLLPGYTPELLDRKVQLPGFSKALAGQGWLLILASALEIPKFSVHNGASGKRRAQAKRTMEMLRSQRNNGATKAQPEKRREEKSKDSPTPHEKTDHKPIPLSEFAGTPEDLAQQWCFVLTRKKLQGPADSPLDIAPRFAELIRLGHNPEKLLDAVLSPSRNRSELFWQFEDRLVGKHGEKTPDSAEEAAARQARASKRRAEDEERDRQIREQGQGPSMKELMSKKGKA